MMGHNPSTNNKLIHKEVSYKEYFKIKPIHACMATKIAFRVEIISFTILFKHSIQKSLKDKTYWLSQFHMKNQCKNLKNSGFQNIVLYSKCEKGIFEVLFNLVKFPQPAYDIS